MADTRRYEHAVPGADFDLTRVETYLHGALQDELFMFDLVVTMTGDPTTGVDPEMTGDEVGNPTFRPHQDLERNPSTPRYRGLVHGFKCTNYCGWSVAHRDLQDRSEL
jgi:hypothetical protein